MASMTDDFPAVSMPFQALLFLIEPSAACGTDRSKSRYMPMVTISPLLRVTDFISLEKVK